MAGLPQKCFKNLYQSSSEAANKYFSINSQYGTVSGSTFDTFDTKYSSMINLLVNSFFLN